ncbi:leucine-rich repeat-containing protein 47-like [Oppia nitens]|uniref:leucine-rich repeat-containing protein 47-like n=1 Tax=Oppia nitens TaxID=1686743 RepID=UPI0023DCB009|nr:leucine-rich repeat-containing protein 47-like [Oppia nitens]
MATATSDENYDYKRHVRELAKAMTTQSAAQRQLLLSGPKINKSVIADNGQLDQIVFKLESLNFFECIKCDKLVTLSPQVSNLTNLTSLILHSNGLQSLPPEVGSLTKLKFLDVSRNQLTELPDTIGHLTALQMINIEYNKLTAVPDFSALTGLLTLKLSGNQLTQFPTSICCGDQPLQHLSEIHANTNLIEEIPHNINKLPALKTLDLHTNQIQTIPGQLGDCNKLKDINLKNNKIKDRRLVKLIDQCHTKQILDYIRANCSRSQKSSNNKDSVNDEKLDEKESGNRDASQDRRLRAKDARRRRRSSSRSPRQSESNDKPLLDSIQLIGVDNDEWFKTTTTPAVHELRKIVVCLVRNVDLNREGILKKFIQLQTGLHTGICGHRQHATIATHDLSKISGKQIHFDVKPPTKIRFVPLNRHKDVTAQEFYKQLNEEAEAYRKEKKRQTYSGIHKYLYLLKGKQRFPCVLDDNKTVISLPPLTNSETTKISENTKDLLLEVTGESVPTCRKVMDALLHAMLKLGLGNSSTAPTTDISTGDQKTNGDQPPQPLTAISDCVSLKTLTVEPVKVVDIEGKLYVQYPSKTDLIFEDIEVKRYKE